MLFLVGFMLSTLAYTVHYALQGNMNMVIKELAVTGIVAGIAIITLTVKEWKRWKEARDK
jgi:hypothetical protein